MHCWRDGRIGWRTLARDGVVAIFAFLGSCLVIRDGFGWLRTLTTPTLGHTALAPASLLADLMPVDALRGVGLLAMSAIGPLRRAVMREGVLPRLGAPEQMRAAH